jgi:hypothetical protein
MHSLRMFGWGWVVLHLSKRKNDVLFYQQLHTNIFSKEQNINNKDSLNRKLSMYSLLLKIRLYQDQ